MANFGKSNAKGRSSGKFGGRKGKLLGPPPGEPFAWLTTELLASPAWRSMGINARRMIDFLLVEHMNHAGQENGNLLATYDQLVAFGLTSSSIKSAIQELVSLRLVDVEYGGRWAGKNTPNIYRLTFYADREGNPPTNAWKGITEQNALDIKPKKQTNLPKRKNKISNTENSSTILRFTAVPDKKSRGAEK